MAFSSHLLQCFMCQRPKYGRSPRSLVCQHSFCSECLEADVEKRSKSKKHRDTIQCPVCKRITHLPDDGILGLHVDFRVEQVEALPAQVDYCQPCKYKGKTKKPTGRCVNCDRLLCIECRVIHLSDPLFDGHKIVELTTQCSTHGRLFTHVCLQCYLGLCCDCVLMQKHKDHEMGEFPGITDRMKRLFGQQVEELRRAYNELMVVMNTNMNEVSLKLRPSEEGLRQAGDKIKRHIDGHVAELIRRHSKEHSDALATAFTDHNESKRLGTNMVEQIQRFHDLDDIPFVASLADERAKLQRTIQAVKDAKVYPASKGVAGDVCPQSTFEDFAEVEMHLQLVCPHFVWKPLEEPKNMLGKLVKVLEVKSEGQIKLVKPLDLATLPDGSVLVADQALGHVNRIGLKGNLVASYYPINTGSDVTVSCISADHGKIYVALSDGKTIFYISSRQTMETIHMKPQVSNISALSAAEDTLLVAQTGMMKHQIHFYDIKTGNAQQTKIKTSVACMKLAFWDGTYKLLVSNSDNNKLEIYSKDGSLLNTIDSHLAQPRGVVQAVNGRLLVADIKEHCVFEYDVNGKYLNKLLTPNSGLSHPYALAYSHPYLWVSEYNSSDKDTPGRLKLFKYSDMKR